jgi:light-regulated signal transduction histidine kinase (bacteriophytochrome)
VPLKDENGKPVKWYGTSTNIHEQKSVEEELEQRVDERTADLQESNKSLKRANTELEQFTYVSHHDLQEPLRKIIMFSDMVQSDNKNQLTEASQQRLERVTSAARRMSAALRDVLDYASLNREEAAVQVDLEEVLAAVQQDLELLITEKKANIMSQTLPTVNAIPGQMHQLFYNLINNALKFTNPGKQPVINITCRKLDKTEASTHTELNLGKHYYHIMVQDNGIGFQPDAAERIFGMFQRLHSKDAYAGTGIGLALVKKVVMNHHGKIWAESSPGEGSSFNVLLPV